MTFVLKSVTAPCMRVMFMCQSLKVGSLGLPQCDPERPPDASGLASLASSSPLKASHFPAFSEGTQGQCEVVCVYPKLGIVFVNTSDMSVGNQAGGGLQSLYPRS